MIIHDCIQGSQDWLALRSGIPTSSDFSRLITPKTGKASEQCVDYMFTLLAERLMGHPCEEFISHWMDRGSQLESEAVRFYELQVDMDTEKIGFITNDAGSIGTSPDRSVGDVGLLEIKVPKEHTHVGYLLNRGIDSKYYPQVQGQMWVAEKEFVDVLSYHPEMPPALIRVERDDKFIAMLATVVTKFSEVLEAQYQVLVERGTKKSFERAPVNLMEILKQSLVAINN